MDYVNGIPYVSVDQKLHYRYTAKCMHRDTNRRMISEFSGIVLVGSRRPLESFRQELRASIYNRIVQDSNNRLMIVAINEIYLNDTDIATIPPI